MAWGIENSLKGDFEYTINIIFDVMKYSTV